MKSIRTKLALAMIACTAVAVTIISGIHIRNILHLNRDDSNRYVWMLCEEYASEFDSRLYAIEEAMDLMTHYAGYILDDADQTIAQRAETLKAACLRTASYITDAYSVYFHADPERYGTDYDFFYRCNVPGSEPVELEPHDPRTYEAQFGQPADWYYNAAQSGTAQWLPPRVVEAVSAYDGELVVGYTTPLYLADGTLLGVVGMDFPLNAITSELHSIRLYESGYVFLTSREGVVLDHPTDAYGTDLSAIRGVQWELVQQMLAEPTHTDLVNYEVNGRPQRMATVQLRNGMVLIAAVPVAEINAAVYRTIWQSAICFVALLAVCTVLIYVLVHRFLHPLAQLTEASRQIINGDMEVSLPYQGEDELGVLTENFRQMTVFLRRRMAKYNTMAYTDAMTGVKNKASYEMAVSLMETRMEEGHVEFGIVVFDLNNLKRTNDKLGHEAGDRLIKHASTIICHAFSHSPVYRIGGDEFAALLEGEDYHNSAACFDKMCALRDQINSTLPIAEQVSIAYGMARFTPGQDKTYHDVFTRADTLMYDRKRYMKQSRSRLEL